MMRRLLAVCLFLASATAAAAQPTVFLVRHAERADTTSGGPKMMANDPDLSAAGVARAESLAKMLKDAKISAIYTTEFRRTRQTAAPLGKVLEIEPTIVSSKDLPGLAQKIKAASGNVLVVGHSDTIPALLKALGISDPVTIGETEFDNLFIASRGSLMRLHY